MATAAEWGPDNPDGSLVPILEASIEQAAPRATGALTACDRCDQCGGQALFRLHRPRSARRKAGDLELCGHHHRKNADALKADGWTVTETLEIS